MYYNRNKFSLRVYSDFKDQSRSITGKCSQVSELRAMKAMVQCAQLLCQTFQCTRTKLRGDSYLVRLFSRPTLELSFRKTLRSKPTDMRLRFSMITSPQRLKLFHSMPPILGLKRYPQLAWKMSSWQITNRIPQHLPLRIVHHRHWNPKCICLILSPCWLSNDHDHRHCLTSLPSQSSHH